MTGYARLCVHIDKTRGKGIWEINSCNVRMVELPYPDPRTECESEVAQSSPTLRSHGLKPARLLSPWDSPGKNTGVGCHFLFQGIVPTQVSNPGLQGDTFTVRATRETT